MGITDLNKKYELNEIVKGDSIFCATGITTSDVLAGIEINESIYKSETFVTHKSLGYKDVIKKENPIKTSLYPKLLCVTNVWDIKMLLKRKILLKHDLDFW